MPPTPPPSKRQAKAAKDRPQRPQRSLRRMWLSSCRRATSCGEPAHIARLFRPLEMPQIFEKALTFIQIHSTFHWNSLEFIGIL